MRVDGDQADGALARERSEPLPHLRDGLPEPPMPADLDGDEIAFFGVERIARTNGKLATEAALFDRNQTAAAIGQRAKNPQRAMLGPIDNLDRASAVANAAVRLGGFLGPQERAIADAGHFAGARPARHVEADFRRGAVGLLVPFRRHRD